MQQGLDTAQLAPAAKLSVRVAHSARDIRRAQKLRYQVFAKEMGAQLASAEDGIDRDEYDPYCDHLIVEDNQTGKLVGTYRMLPPHKARSCPACIRNTNST